MMNNCCCSIINLLKNSLKNGVEIINDLGEITCTLEGMSDNISNVSKGLYVIQLMLAHENPLTIAAEYPDPLADKFVVSAPYTRFLDLLNTDIYVIFKIDNINYDLPVYFKDSIEYEHPIVLSDGTPVKANLLLLNGIYSAKYLYSGSYIILDSLTPLNPDVIPV